MKVLVFGSGGQLGWELQRTCPENVVLTSCDFPKVDFFSSKSISDCIKSLQPDCIINAAAYTAVDQAEHDSNAADTINHLAVRKIASLCQENNIFLTQISTDFVFNGRHYRPYLPDDKPDPMSIYGVSKLKGEEAVKEILEQNAVIIRTAWLYSSHGNNFVKSMISLMKEKSRLTVIDEQIGTPTWAMGLATVVWKALEVRLTGTHHYTDAGVASWYDFAMAILEEGLGLELIKNKVPIDPIPAKAYPTPAKRPFYSVLDKTSMWQALDIEPVHWRCQLRSMLRELP